MAATVLVACSDPDSCTTWAALLVRLGYDVIFAPSGETALTLCDTLQPDLTLLDEALPDMSAAEVYRRLRENPRNERIAVVQVKGAAPVAAPEIARSPREAYEVWGWVPTPSALFERVRFLNQLKAYIDEETQAVISGLARAIDARDHREAEHGVRVSNYAVRLGQSLGLNEVDLETLRIGGLLHDIGKIAVSQAVLSKPGHLTPEENRLVRQHPIIGEEICAPLKSLRHVLPVIRYHHERMDGSGYPDGLCGDQIPITAQVLHVADICDALTTDRPYRRAMSLPSALLCLYHDAERGWIDERMVHHMAGLILGIERIPLAARGATMPLLAHRSAMPS